MPLGLLAATGACGGCDDVASQTVISAPFDAKVVVRTAAKLGARRRHTVLLEIARLAMESGAATSSNAEPTEMTQKMQSFKVKLDDSWGTDKQGTVVAIDSFVKVQHIEEGNKAILPAMEGVAGAQSANKVGATPKEGDVNSRVIA